MSSHVLPRTPAYFRVLPRFHVLPRRIVYVSRNAPVRAVTNEKQLAAALRGEPQARHLGRKLCGLLGSNLDRISMESWRSLRGISEEALCTLGRNMDRDWVASR